MASRSTHANGCDGVDARIGHGGSSRPTSMADLDGSLGMGAAAGMAIWDLPPVDLHGFLHRVGVMDPLCRGTRSAMFAARRDLAQAWKPNSLGIAAVIAAITVGARAAVGLISGRWLGVDVALSPRAARTCPRGPCRAGSLGVAPTDARRSADRVALRPRAKEGWARLREELELGLTFYGASPHSANASRYWSALISPRAS